MKRVWLILDSADKFRPHEMVFKYEQAAKLYVERFGNPSWKVVSCKLTSLVDVRNMESGNG